MVICFIALGVFAVLGIFSAKYRAYFFEALDCVLRKATLRKCTTSFDQKMKVKICTRLSRLNKSFGSYVFKHFETVSLIFTVIMVISLVWSVFVSGTALYNWVAFGNCNGPDSTQACILNTITGLPQPTTSGAASYISDNNLKCDLNNVIKDANGFAYYSFPSPTS